MIKRLTKKRFSFIEATFISYISIALSSGEFVAAGIAYAVGVVLTLILEDLGHA